MRLIHLLVAVYFLISILFIGDAHGDENGTSFFDIGSFTVTDDWELAGRYMPSGLEGCTVSVYGEDGKHVMDIMYTSSCVDIYLEIFNNSLLKTLLERGAIEKMNLLKISLSKGPQVSFTYQNCSVELHDASIRFLRIRSPGKIVFSNLTGYDINKSSYNVATLKKGNFYGAIIGNRDLVVNDGEIIAYKGVMFRGIVIQNETNVKEMLTVENAIKCGTLGGEITIVKDGNKIKSISTCYYNNVSIELLTQTLTNKKAELIVSGDEHSAGKTIKINVGKGAFSPDNLKVKFDGKDIPMADNITDVLNPNDDGLQPEYVMVKVSGGKGDEFFLLISIPHFSKHIITLQSLSKNPLFSAIAIASAFSVLAVASWALFKK